jgi:hypothetical protein
LVAVAPVAHQGLQVQSQMLKLALLRQHLVVAAAAELTAAVLFVLAVLDLVVEEVAVL